MIINTTRTTTENLHQTLNSGIQNLLDKHLKHKYARKCGQGSCASEKICIASWLPSRREKGNRWNILENWENENNYIRCACMQKKHQFKRRKHDFNIT